MKFLVINGPNINFLGIREPEIYGNKTYSDLLEMIRSCCADEGIECECFQSNHEGAIVDEIQRAYGRIDGIIINPAAYTHTSIAIPDAIKAVGIPCCEVHISDINAREEYRRVSYVAPVCEFSVVGKGFDGYCEAIRRLKIAISASY